MAARPASPSGRRRLRRHSGPRSRIEHGDIVTAGIGSDGILAQSIGGGGGNGGFSGAIALGSGAAFSDFFGGGAGGGNHAGAVDVTSTGSITTQKTTPSASRRSRSAAAAAMAGSPSPPPRRSISAIGKATAGDAGDGGFANSVTVVSNGTIQTAGNLAYGILAQSIGGGGGNGGFSAAVGVAFSGRPATGSVGRRLAGSGGGVGGAVVTSPSYNNILTRDRSKLRRHPRAVDWRRRRQRRLLPPTSWTLAIAARNSAAASRSAALAPAAAPPRRIDRTELRLGSDPGLRLERHSAQSIGGGGGNGGFSIAGRLHDGRRGPWPLSVGAAGAGGGSAGVVEVDSYAQAAGGAPIISAPAPDAIRS